MRPLIPLVLCAALVGCNKIQSNVSFDPVPTEPVVQKVDDHSCEWDAADYELRTHLLAFEMTSRNEGSFGFNLLNKFFSAFKLKFKVDKGQMTFGMDLTKPQDSQNEIVNVMGMAEYSKKELGFTIDFGQIQAGLDHQSAVPVTTLVNRGLMNTLNEVKARLQALPLEWATHVSQVNGSKVRIPVGLLAGVRKGDEFAIYNVEAQWDGTPCQSHYFGEYKKSQQPVAIATVTDINEVTAFLDLNQMQEEVKVGARVEISKLVDSRTTLQKSIRIVGITSEPVTLDNGSKINLLPYVTEVLKPVLSQGGFYIRQAH